MSSEPVSLPKRTRPLSVWVLTVLNVLIAIVLIAASFKGEDWGFPRAQVAFWGLLGIAISIAAHMTWFGSRRGRNLLLGFSTIYLGVLLFQGLQTIAWVNTWSGDEHIMTRAIGWVAFAVICLVANYRFLLGKRARAFFA
jgi:hypothetical protein